MRSILSLVFLIAFASPCFGYEPQICTDVPMSAATHYTVLGITAGESTFGDVIEKLGHAEFNDFAKGVIATPSAELCYESSIPGDTTFISFGAIPGHPQVDEIIRSIVLARERSEDSKCRSTLSPFVHKGLTTNSGIGLDTSDDHLISIFGENAVSENSDTILYLNHSCEAKWNTSEKSINEYIAFYSKAYSITKDKQKQLRDKLHHNDFFHTFYYLVHKKKEEGKTSALTFTSGAEVYSEPLLP